MLLVALGNAGLPAALPAIVERVGDASASVRAGAASALRKQSGPEADRALRTLSEDASPEVAEVAIRSIGEHENDPVAVAGLVADVTDGHIVQAADGSAIEVLRHHLRDTPGATAALSTIAARHPDDLALQARIRALLEGTKGAS